MKKALNIICVSFTALLWIIIFYSLISCGARKVTIDKSKEETKTETIDNSVIEKQSETNIKTTVETKVDDKNEITTSETVFEPIDNTKESFVIEKDGTKVVLNNAKKIIRNTAQKNNTQSESKQSAEEVEKESEKDNKNVSLINEGNKTTTKKAVDKKQFNPVIWHVGMAIFLILLVIAYFVLKRLKVI